MISSSHTTVSISHFLNEWMETGATVPKIVNCDGSKAILAAAIRSFTQYNTIGEYSKTCWSGPLPKCYVRLDVAHFLKIYCDLISNLTKLNKVKIFLKLQLDS